MKRLSGGGERLAALFRDSIRFIEQWGVSEESLRLPASDDRLIQAFARELYINDPPGEWYDYVVVDFNAIRLADANGFSGDRLLNLRRDANNMRCDDVLVASDRFRSIPDDIRSAAIFVNYAEDFLRLRSELPGIVNAIEKLKDCLA
jgi:hypothetical protein